MGKCSGGFSIAVLAGWAQRGWWQRLLGGRKENQLCHRMLLGEESWFGWGVPVPSGGYGARAVKVAATDVAVSHTFIFFSLPLRNARQRKRHSAPRATLAGPL